MTTEEFWDKYSNEDLLDIFDITCDFFSKKLPKEFLDDYDVGEVILETREHQEIEQNYDNVLKFTEIIQNKQKKLYEEYFQYFDGFLLDYYCFKQDPTNIQKAFSLFIENPLQDYDAYLLGFNKLLYYQQSDIIKQAVLKNFNEVRDSEELMGDGEFDLALCMYYILMQETYENNDVEFNLSGFLSKISDYNFEFDDSFLSSLEKGLSKPILDAVELKELFIKDKSSALIIIRGNFQREMHHKGFAFYLSAKIWDKILGYWQDSNGSESTTDSFFKVKSKQFEKYLLDLSRVFFFEKKHELIGTLWGSVYVLEYLNKNKLVSEETFIDFLEISKDIKGKVIGLFTPELWNSNFVHTWQKPDCISETEFLEENKIFQKSFSFKNKDIRSLRSFMSDELSKIGELSEYIIKENELGFETDMNKMPLGKIGNYGLSEPVRAEKKPGRNEPCPCGSGKKYKKCCGQE